jgi:hypothetical protein
MPAEQPRIEIVPAAGAKADDNVYRLALVKILLGLSRLWPDKAKQDRARNGKALRQYSA